MSYKKLAALSFAVVGAYFLIQLFKAMTNPANYVDPDIYDLEDTDR